MPEPKSWTSVQITDESAEYVSKRAAQIRERSITSRRRQDEVLLEIDGSLPK